MMNVTSLRGISYLFSEFGSKVVGLIPTNYARRIYGTAGFLKCGFPKSGNNWVHFLIANTIVRSACRQDDIHFRNNDEWLSTTVPLEPPVPGFPKLLSNTEPFENQHYLDDDTRVLYIVRHPGDVMESYYHYLKYRWNEDVGEFSEFIRDDEWGVPAWRDHVLGWEDRRDLLVTFEDLKDDPHRELGRIVTLFDREFDEEAIDYAVERSSFEEMRRMEDEYGIRVKYGANPDYSFMRKGESDRGETYFDPSDYAYLRRTAGKVMDRYGYDVPESAAMETDTRESA